MILTRLSFAPIDSISATVAPTLYTWREVAGISVPIPILPLPANTNWLGLSSRSEQIFNKLVFES